VATRRRAALFYLLLVLTPLVGSLAAGEAMLRLVAPQDLSGSWLTYGPRGLVVNKPHTTARHQQGDVIVHYRFNGLHQRGAAPAPGANPVLVLGDSFTFGWLLDEPASYIGRLQGRVDERFGKGRYQLQNAATAGWGMADYLTYLETFGERVAPALVAVFVSYDDVDRALRKPLYSLAADGRVVAHDLSGERLWLKQMIDRVPGYDWLLEHSHLAQLLRNAAVRGPGSGGRSAAMVPTVASSSALLSPGSDRRSELAHALMTHLKEWCERRNVPLLVLTTGWFEAAGIAWLPDVGRALGDSFVNLAPRVLPVLRADPDAYRFSTDGHPNARGAALIADAAWPALERSLAATQRPPVQ